MTKPTRVLHPITRLIVGGAQENTMFTAERLAPDRWHTEIICGPQTGPEGSLIGEVRDRDIPLTIEPTLVRELHPIKDLLCLIRLTRFMKRGKFTIVHTHSSKAGIVARWAARFAGVPIIVHTVHGWGFHERQSALTRGLYIFLEKITEPFTDRLIVVAERDRDTGLKEGIGTREKYVTIRSAIDIAFYEKPRKDAAWVKAQLGIPEDRQVICSVTRLSAQKDPLTLIKTAGRVCKAHPQAHFLIVGDGPLRNDVERAIRQANLSECVTLAGLRRDIPELLGCSELFTLTSLWEGLPRVFLQAMAAGLPIVATRTGGSEELLLGGQTGLLADGQDAEALASAMLRLLDNPEEAQRLSRAGKERVRTEFSIEKMIDDIDRLYQDLMKAKQ